VLKHKQNVDAQYLQALKEVTSKYMEGGISFVKVCNEFNKNMTFQMSTNSTKQHSATTLQANKLAFPH